MSFHFYYPINYSGVRGAAVGWGTALQDVRSRVGFPMVSYSFRPHCGPWADSASYRNEYQEYVLEGEMW